MQCFGTSVFMTLGYLRNELSHRLEFLLSNVYETLCQSQLEDLICRYLLYAMVRNDTDTWGIENQLARDMFIRLLK